MSLVPLLQGSILLATYTLLGCALWSSFSSTLRQMISRYIYQAYTLAAITWLTALDLFARAKQPEILLLVGMMGVLPLILAHYIQPFLARATVPGSSSLLQVFDARVSIKWLRGAEQIWLQHGRTRISPGANIVANLGLTSFSLFIAFQLATPGQSGSAIDPMSLAISLALLMIGLFSMIVKTDILSQVMGFLVMEQGMFLAAIKVITLPALTIIFVISMFAYILVTLFILGVLLPSLHSSVGSISIDQFTKLKG